MIGGHDSDADSDADSGNAYSASLGKDKVI